MDFYTNPLSANCRKVDAVAKQLGIELNTIQVDLGAGGGQTPEYLAINPNGKVPALVDGDVKLWESNAIQCYLATKTDNDLWPKSNLRYDIMRWQAWELAHFGAAVRELSYERMIKRIIGAGEADAARCEVLDGNFERHAKVLDDHLDGKRYLVNDQLTVADFCVASSLTYATPAGLKLDRFPNIKRWLSALDEQPGWRASAPPPM